ncbi:hypothetical protein [Chryseobacterium echinoideorum]|uniref:hypothetical protein n=1 Tax=Chryseobacterium echinoideorum TaxID=1549648 RepID=UPI00118626C1|nr:hypothetical protein [Chryseobacterium echinoideorum]
MKKLFFTGTLAMFIAVTSTSCSKTEKSGGSAEIENTDVVPSGKYTGTAKEVDAEEKEIYVETADGKILELYLKDYTAITKNGQPAMFSDLKQGGKVEVTVEKMGNKLDPKAVNILE